MLNQPSQIAIPGFPVPDKIIRLQDKFGVPPFSVLDARQGYWQDRKRDWLAIGIKGELGRGSTNNPGSRGDTRTGPWKHFAVDNPNNFGAEQKGYSFAAKSNSALSDKSQKALVAYASGFGGTIERENGETGTSIFDQVLCELSYRWFCPHVHAQIFDPFAGGSVRGIVASCLGFHYTGIELSERQIEANKKQAAEILLTGENGWAGKPDCGRIQWIYGDSRQASALASNRYDFVFSCPPYGNLEVYSDDTRDLSTMAPAEFDEAYRDIIRIACGMLKSNRFACFVVGDYRDKQGFYRNFVGQTILAFEEAGMRLYNEGILVTSVGSLPIRVGKQFGIYRKLGKTHQNVLVFYKGNPQQIKADFSELSSGFYGE